MTDPCAGHAGGEHYWQLVKIALEAVDAEIEFKTCLHCGLRLFTVYTECMKENSAWQKVP